MLIEVFGIGDKQKPICKRCKEKGLRCTYAPRKVNFRHWSTDNSTAGFSGDQTWVNSRPRNWKVPVRVESSSGLERSAVSGWTDGQSSYQGMSGTSGSVTSLGCVDPLLVSEGDDHSQHGSTDQTHHFCNDIPGLQESSSTNVSPGDLSSLYFSISPKTSDGDVQFDPNFESDIGQRNNSEKEFPSYGEEEPYFPVHASIQESCLLRYFIEELSPLVSQPLSILYHKH